MRYVVGAGGVRIGSGIGPYLGINVALPAPSFSGSGVFLNPAGIVNAASSAPFTAGIAPGDFITLYGTNLAPGTATAYTVPFPTTAGLDGVQVTVNGLPAPVQFVSPGQISAIVPYAVGSSIARIQVNNNGVLSNVVTEFVNLTAPGVFTVPPGGVGYGAVLHGDYSLVTAQSPAQVGETVSVYLTGLGTTNPVIPDGSAGPASSQTNNTIEVYIGGQAATVGYSGLAPQLAGLYQINVTVPSGVTAGDNTLEIVGPDSDAAEALIPVGSGTTASASSAPQPAVRKLPKSSPSVRRPHAAALPLQIQRLDDGLDVGVSHAHLVFHQRRCGALVKRLEQRHLGNGVALGGGKLARAGLFPRADGAIAHHNSHRVPALAIGRDAEDELHSAIPPGVKRPASLVAILIHVAASRGVGLEPAHGGCSGQGRVFSRKKTPKHAFLA